MPTKARTMVYRCSSGCTSRPERKDGGDPVNRADKEVAGEARWDAGEKVYLVNWRQLTERACDWLPGATPRAWYARKGAAPHQVSFSSRESLRKVATLRRRFLSLLRPISATSFIRIARSIVVEDSSSDAEEDSTYPSSAHGYVGFSRANNDREIAHICIRALSHAAWWSRGWNFKPIYLSIIIVHLTLLSILLYAMPSFEYFCEPFSPSPFSLSINSLILIRKFS